jgi:hypothetical protein
MPSTVIRRLEYDESTAALRLEFTSGRIYTYHDVPEHIATSLRNAFGKGEFFNEHIRDRYRFTREN